MSEKQTFATRADVGLHTSSKKGTFPMIVEGFYPYDDEVDSGLIVAHFKCKCERQVSIEFQCFNPCDPRVIEVGCMCDRIYEFRFKGEKSAYGGLDVIFEVTEVKEGASDE